MLCASGLAPCVNAQTLARPGWAGSGVTIEPWWRRAVFYRIDVEKFQDSDGDGRGDLAGIAMRLDYLQALGVDAIALRTPFAPADLDDLVKAAGGHHIRVMVELGPIAADASADAEVGAQADDAYVGAARTWLQSGVAGLYVDTADVAKAGDERAVKLMRSLRVLTDGFPGGRILVAEAAPANDSALQKQWRRRHI